MNIYTQRPEVTFMEDQSHVISGFVWSAGMLSHSHGGSKPSDWGIWLVWDVSLSAYVQKLTYQVQVNLNILSEEMV